jgi:hypothetical protein
MLPNIDMKVPKILEYGMSIYSFLQEAIFTLLPDTKFWQYEISLFNSFNSFMKSTLS